MYKQILQDRYLAAVALLTLAFTVYWIYYGNLIFTTYQVNFYDIGIWTYSAYWHLHGTMVPGLEGVVQYLIFANHISPFSMLLLPLFYLYQYPITLIAIQDIAITIVAILVYVVTKDLIKMPQIGFAMAVAYLLNPGVTGMLYFPIHSEAFMPLFYVLSFYFYMKGRKVGFLASYIILLSIMEDAPFVAGTLLLGLLAYELSHKHDNGGASDMLRTARFKLLVDGLVLTALAICLYYVISSYLVSVYPQIPYYELSPLMRYGSFINLGAIASSIFIGVPYNPSELLLSEIAGIAIAFFGFGITSLKRPSLAVILLLPWLVGLFLLHDSVLGSYYSQYYAYVVGGSFVAAILGMLIIKKDKHIFWFEMDIKRERVMITSTILSLSALLALGLASALILSYITIINTPSHSFTLVKSGMAIIPQNATVMSQDIILPHLYRIRDIEFQPDATVSDTLFSPRGMTLHWFSPEYIVAYENTTKMKNGSALQPTILSYVNNSYALIYNESGLMIYQRISS